MDAPAGSYTAISAGWWHTCALAADQTIECWGDDDFGQLDAPAGRHTALSAGKLHSCAISTDQTIACWGYNIETDGQQVDAPDGLYTAVSAGRSHSCAINTDQAIVCWSDPCATNLEWPIGCRGDSTTAPEGRYTAVAVGGSSGYGMAFGHSCAINVDQTVACWGSDNYDQLRAPAGQYIAITAGDAHSCAISTDHTLACWGRNRDGHTCAIRANNTSCQDRYFSGPTDTPDGRYKAVAAGATHSCAIRADRTIACWGDNRYGQTKARPSPTELPPPGQYTAIATGRYHACAITANEAVACWGRNDFGQSDAPPGQYTAIATGSGHSCAIKTDQAIACWGNNRNDRNGLESDPPAGQYTAIAAGERHTCAIKTDEAVACWGDDSYGQADAPAGRYTAIATGERHSCALKDDHAIVCWGGVSSGQADAPLGTYTAITTGFWHSCAIRTDQTIACWGSKSLGQTDAPAGQYTAIAAGRDHSCAIKADQTIACWGTNSGGQTDSPAGQYTDVASDRWYSCAIKADQTIACWGDNSWVLMDEAIRPTTTTSTSTSATIAAYGDHSCVVKSDQTVDCWGDNSFGQSDAPAGQYIAIATGGSRACAISARNKIGALVLDSNLVCWGSDYSFLIGAPKGRYADIAAHSCAIKADQTIVCWGSVTTGLTDAPAGRHTAIAAGSSHLCAIKTDQTVACWGGNNSSGQSDAPAGQYTAIATGVWHSCAIRIDRTVACWGYNAFGQTDAPVGQYTAIAAGRDHSCAIKTDGTIACWGYNAFGQTDAPVGQYTAIAAGDNHSCAIKTDGTIACWGDNRYGQTDPLSTPYTGEDDHVITNTGADSWWDQPRGLLRVKFHVCTTPELRPFVPADFIEDHVAVLNERVALFYAWQSSGLLSVEFEAGRVLDTPYVPVTYGSWSPECVKQVYDGSDGGGLAHQFYEYGTGVANGTRFGGMGQLGGPLSAIHHPHLLTEAPRAPSGLGLERVLFVAGHELDHNIGVHHFYDASVGYTRTADGVRGMFNEGDRPDNPAFSRVYSCVDVQHFGWPVGQGHPVCALVPELAPVRNLNIAETVDGADILVWQKPLFFGNPVSISGYKIEIRRHSVSTLDVIAQHNLSAAPRTFLLPQQLPPGRYRVFVIASSDIGDSQADTIEFSIFADEYNVKVRPAPAFPDRHSQNTTMDFPMEYELSWEPVPNALSYEILRPSRCPSLTGINEFCVSNEPQITFSESRRELVEGTTYFLTIYARLSPFFSSPVGTVHFTARRNIPEWWTGRDNTPPF